VEQRAVCDSVPSLIPQAPCKRLGKLLCFGMAWIHTVEQDDAGGELSALYAAACDPTTGVLDNILKVHSLHPRGLEAHLLLYTAVMAGTASLRKVSREMIALVVSHTNGCHY
jgi:alkylhydroperoxidase family enzyme